MDAYKLTSEMATTEEYAEQNKYAHSLFVADYTVTHTISWNDLNTAGLILAKAMPPAAWIIRCARRPREVIIQAQVIQNAARPKATNGTGCWTRTTDISKTGTGFFRVDKIL